ncbi:MAG: hypothetical protein VKO39_01700 [Cyanobacteriota bacterium]|nr:hypothetical protein [Cyanobacteriota bacterium]
MQARTQGKPSTAGTDPAHRPPPTPPRVVVVGSGLEASFRRPDNGTDHAARRLARGLSLPHRRIGEPWAPHGQLGQLQASAGGWLASLPLDPGHPLEEGGTWAEALGAWRQPTLLIIAWQQLPSGAAASSIALLRQWRVPLLGVLQWGGSWSPEQRRRDGLPWLGRLEEAAVADTEEHTRDVTHLLLRQWERLDHPFSPGSET